MPIRNSISRCCWSSFSLMFERTTCFLNSCFTYGSHSSKKTMFRYAVFKVHFRIISWVGLNGLEPSTSRLSGVRSNQLSYKPIYKEVLFRFAWKNDLNSKFALRLRLELIKNLMSGSHLLSHTVSSAVPSAAQALTFVFGMRTGVTPGRIATRRI